MATSRFQFSLFLLPIFAWAGAFALNSSGNCLSDQLRLQTEHEGSFRIRDYRNSATDRVELSCSTGRCMLDTGGGRSLMTLDDFKKLQSPSRRLPDPVTLPTLQGPCSAGIKLESMS